MNSAPASIFLFISVLRSASVRHSFSNIYADYTKEEIQRESEEIGGIEIDYYFAKKEYKKAYKLLKAKQWVSLEQQKTIELKLTNQMNEAKRISSELESSLSNHALTKQNQDSRNISDQSAIETGLPPINKELNKKRAAELKLTISKMQCSNQNDTGQD